MILSTWTYNALLGEVQFLVFSRSRVPLPYPDLHNESLSVPRAELQSWDVTPFRDRKASQ